MDFHTLYQRWVDDQPKIPARHKTQDHFSDDVCGMFDIINDDEGLSDVSDYDDDRTLMGIFSKDEFSFLINLLY